MKRYIQILVLIICTLAFGSPSKAQEKGTHYHNLVYNNLIVTHEGLLLLKGSIKNYLTPPHPYGPIYSRQEALRFGSAAVTNARPITAIRMSIKYGEITLIKEDVDAIEQISGLLFGVGDLLDSYISDLDSKKISFMDFTKFREARGKIREAKRLIEGILDRSAGYTIPQDERENSNEQD